jgi:hypothetical protein
LGKLSAGRSIPGGSRLIFFLDSHMAPLEEKTCFCESGTLLYFFLMAARNYEKSLNKSNEVVLK